MTIRTNSKIVTFNNPFLLCGLEDVQPAGSYEIETDEELMEDMSFLGYRRISTLIHLHPLPGMTQTMEIDPIELEIALAHDNKSKAAELRRDPDPVVRRWHKMSPWPLSSWPRC